MRIVKFVIKLIFLLLLLLCAGGAALFFAPAGPLLMPLIDRFGREITPNVSVSDVNGSLYEGLELRGLSMTSGDEELLTLDRAAVSPDWELTLSGSPWISLVEVSGLSADVSGLEKIASAFGGDKKEEEKPKTEIKIMPLRASVSDIRITAHGADGRVKEALLSSLDVFEDGRMTLRASLDGLPLEADGLMDFDAMEIISSDIRLADGHASFRGGVMPPFSLRGDITALKLDPLLAFVPNSPFSAGGRFDGRVFLNGSAEDLTASGVASLQRCEIMDIPLSLRVPWSFANGVAVLNGARLSTPSASVSLSASADISGGADKLRVTAAGRADNVSLTEIGRMFAPEAGIVGTGGALSFNIKAALEDMLIDGTLSARLPEVSAKGHRIVKGLEADVRLAPGETPRAALTGEMFGGKLFGRGEAEITDGAVKPQMVFALVGLDLASVARAFPELASAKPSGKVGVRINVAQDMSVTGTVNSDKLSASGVTISDLAAALGFAGGRASLSSLTGKLGRGTFSASGTADINAKTLSFKAAARDIDPRALPQTAGKFTGLCDIDASVGGTFSNPSASVQMRGRNSRAAGVPLGNLNLSASYANSNVTVPSTRVTLPGGSVSFGGSVSLKGREPTLDFSASTQSINIAETAKVLKLGGGFGGTVRGSVNVKGALSTASVNANLTADNVLVSGLDIPHAELRAGGSMRGITVERIKADIAGGKIDGRGRVTAGRRGFADAAVSVLMNMRGIGLKKLLEPFTEKPPVGGILDGTLTLGGTAAKPNLRVSVTSPITAGQMMIDSAVCELTAPSASAYMISSDVRMGELRIGADTKLTQKGGVWSYSAQTRPISIEDALKTFAPAAAGTAKGSVRVNAAGSTDPKAPIKVSVSVPKLTAIDKVAVTDISLPITVSMASGRAVMKDGSAKLSGGRIGAALNVDLNASEWNGTVNVRNLNVGKLAAPFLEEGELVGSADADVKMKGRFGVLNTSYAEGSFITSEGFFHKMDIIDRITPTKKITFENVRGTFFWDGSDLFINPGSQATAGPRDELYRYFSLNGACGIPGKGLDLVFKGRFNIRMLDRLLGAMKGVFAYVTGGLSDGGIGMMKDAVGRALGVKRHSFQDVSFKLAGSWDKLSLLALKIDKPIQDILPIDVLNGDSEEQKKGDRKFEFNIRIPTGPGNKDSIEDVSTSEQLKEQFIDNLFDGLSRR